MALRRDSLTLRRSADDKSISGPILPTDPLLFVLWALKTSRTIKSFESWILYEYHSSKVPGSE